MYVHMLILFGVEFYSTVSAQLEARASIFHRGFLGGPLIKFIIPGVLIKEGLYLL